jgi:hypothetical protein
MVFKGYVKNGMVVAEGALPFPEGTEVWIEAVTPPTSGEDIPSRPLSERLSTLIGKLDDMPSDWSENHDTYLRASHRQS